MPSIIQGYEYDIFISYRQNDNRSGWVTEFVKHLNEELPATIKDPVSVYFDSNPHDGLLQTHDVDESLKDKLKCLIFIPIISQTYCDPKCFAWNNEFLAFRKIATKDQFGLKIKIANGNVASRILPVRIHDLDPTDKALLENELGPLRSIDFIFKSSGVNRPLRANEDHPNDNANRTFYRDQINKVANAIKEILAALQQPDNQQAERSLAKPTAPGQRPRSSTKKITYAAIGLMISFLLLYAVSQFLGREEQETKPIDKSIAVLPFADMSPNHDQEFFGDGVADEIINALVQLNDLKVIARTSSFQFKGKNEDLRTIGEKLNVATVLEGSVRKSKNQLRITAQLIKTSDGTHLWSKSYDRSPDDIFKVQDEIASAVVEALKVTLSGNLLPANVPTKNQEAYNLYLQGRYFYDKTGPGDMERSIDLFKRAIKMDSSFAIAWCYFAIATFRLLPSANNPDWELAKAANKKALELNPNLADCYGNLSIFARNEYDLTVALMEIKKALSIDPRNPRILRNASTLSSTLGRFEESVAYAKKATSIDPLQPLSFWALYRAYYSSGRIDEADSAYHKMVELSPDFKDPFWILGKFFLQMAKAGPEIALTNLKDERDERIKLAGTAIVSFALGRKRESDEALSEFIKKYQDKNSCEIAQIYSFRNEKDEALIWLNRAFKQKENGVLYLLAWPVYKNLRTDPRFTGLLKKMKFPSE